MSRRTVDILLLIFAVFLILIGSAEKSEASEVHESMNPIQLFCQNGRTATFFRTDKQMFVNYEDRLYSKEFELGRNSIFMEVGGQVLKLTLRKDHAVIYLFGDSARYEKGDWRDKVICQ